MKRADIKIGFLCNNYCQHCVQGDKRVTFGNKSFEQIKEELHKARAACEDVIFTGGEPTIHRYFFDVVRLAKKIGFKGIQLQTNGRMFAYPAFSRDAVAAGVTDFCVALLGHCDSVHDRLTRVKGSFKQTIEGIMNLKSSGVRVADNTVITKINFLFLPKIGKLLVDLGVDQFQFAFVHPFGSAKTNFRTIVPKMSRVMPYVKAGLEVGNNAGKVVMTEAIPYCMMKGYEHYIAERNIPETEVFDSDFFLDNYSQIRRFHGKAKGPDCKICRYDNLCEGPWKEYPEYFGWKEFKPVSSKR